MRGLPAAVVLIAACGTATPAPEPVPVSSPPGPPAEAEPEPAAPPPALIPGTGILDTPDNREVIAVCERYRAALEARDSDALLALASARYLDDNGTPFDGDDVDLAGLQATLPDRMAAIDEVHYEMEYRDIVYGESSIEVSYDYTASFTMDGRVIRRTDSARLVLVHESGTLLIESGM